MGLEDAPAVAAALHVNCPLGLWFVDSCLQRWSVSRDVAWRACAVLAGVAGDHGEKGAHGVKEAG